MIVVLAFAACTSSTKGRAAAELALSSAAQEKGDYPAALEHAQKAIEFAPENADPHFAAAVIADTMCVPTAQPSPNMTQCNLAIKEYTRVLQIDASHPEAAKDFAYLLWRLGREESAEVDYRMALASAPTDPEVLAAIGAIDASRSWKELARRKADAGIPDETPLIEVSSCFETRQRNLDRVNEGISFLTRAVQSRADNAEFKVWLSRLYRIRAEIQCGNQPAYRADMDDARNWDRLGGVIPKADGEQLPRRYPAAPPPEHPEQ